MTDLLTTSNCRDLVVVALFHCPRPIREAAMNECFFYMPCTCTAGAYFGHWANVNRKLIYLSPYLRNLPRQRQIETVLHEIAHFACGHESSRWMQSSQMEDEAKHWAKKWLNTFKKKKGPKLKQLKLFKDEKGKSKRKQF